MTTTKATDALVRGLVAGDRAAIDALVAAAGTSRDATVLVAAALVVDDGTALLARAATAAPDLRTRQLVAIAAAFLDGDADRVHLLARDHLAEHPDSLLAAHLAAGTETRRFP
ncbi:hypothetical protein [Actinomycetospora sp.]|jgi:hypothetical protein|uniref:hypothetical protein n=1 Tax=Actinomycetospora sp. TaxID=1872135 RepID=UPI002F429EFB